MAYDIQHMDSTVLISFYSRIQPLRDKLSFKLNEKSFENETLLKEQVMVSVMDDETKQILLLNLDNLFLENRKDIYAQNSVNIRADEFLRSYKSGRFEDFTKKYIRYKLV